MELLFYNELDSKAIEKKYKKVIDCLEHNNFKQADVKKMQNTGFYRAKLDDTNRLLFKFARYEDKTFILVLELIINHEYSKSKFLRGAQIDESKVTGLAKPEEIPAEDLLNVSYLNQGKNKFHILDKILSFDNFQDEIFKLPTPLIIIGSAGSGKTVLTLEKLKQLAGNIAYISLSTYLVENAEKIYYSNQYDNPHQEVDFLSFAELIESIEKPNGKELVFKQFEYWFNRHYMNSKLKEPYRLFEEFKGVLTGSVLDKPYLLRKDYLSLGVKQSIFLAAEREKVYDVFERYLDFLKTDNYFDSNVLAHSYLSKVEQKYDYIVVDEVQDFTNIQLKMVLSLLKERTNFILSGDSNQIVHPNFFSWSKIKSMFYLDNLPGSVMRILTTNYRNSKEITDISNLLLRIKNARFGSIDKESTYLIQSVSKVSGNIQLLNDDKKIKAELNQKTQNSARYAVLVMNNEQKTKAREFFKTPLIFSIHEAKGLEYENIILINFISDYSQEFFEITRDVDEAALTDELKYSRARNKEDKDLEVFKFYVNSLYVAFTRTIKNMYVIESNQRHRLLELLKLKETNQKINIETQKSTDDEWLQEAKRLEMQGKYEQARQIRDKILGIAYISPEQYLDLRTKALDPTKKEDEVKRERKDLFTYATARKKYEDIQSLANLKFQRAVLFIQELRQIQKEYVKNIRLERNEGLVLAIKKYGVDFRTLDDNMTGLMIACMYGNKSMVHFFLTNEADPKLKTQTGVTALDMCFKSLHRSITKKIQQPSYLQANDFVQVYERLRPLHFRCLVNNRIIKIGFHSMEYMLLNCLLSMRTELIKPEKLDGLTMDQFEEFAEMLPESILSVNRKKRSYINALLSNNEIDRVFIYNKHLFQRVGRGAYRLNPDLVFIEDEIVNA